MITKIKNYFSKDWFNKVEPYLFLSLMVAGTLPLLFSNYFVTLDGPAHLYNANLIKEIFLGNHSSITDLFAVNDFPVPNWSGHLLMALFNLLLPAYLSEKLVFLLYFVLTPLFFRKLLLHLYPENRILTYLILLFVHNHLVYYGFINMSLGIMFLFITGYYFVRYCGVIRLKTLLILSLLLLAIYFSHVLIFLIALMFIAVTIILKAQTEHIASGIKVLNMKELKTRMIALIISAVPGIILSVAYFLSIDSVEKGPRLELSELFNYIIDIRPLLTFCYCESWTSLTHILMALFALMILGNIYLLIKSSCSIKDGQLFVKLPLKLSVIWFVISAIFLGLFLVVPNSILMSERLIVLFYLFFIIWLASLKFPRIIKAISLIVVVLLHNFFIHRHFEAIRRLSKDAAKIVQVSEHIKPNSMVLTFNYSDNWLHSHITGYLGSNRAIAVIENYEAALKWFPIQWKNDVYDIDRLIVWGVDNKQIAGDFYINEADSSLFSLKRINGQLKEIPYVFVMGDFENRNDSLTLKIKQVLKLSYQEIQTNNLCKLFELKYAD